METQPVKKTLSILLSVILAFALATTFAGEAHAAPQNEPDTKVRHHLVDTDYQTVYYDPNRHEEEAALMAALILLVPGMAQYKTLVVILTSLGLYSGFKAVFKKYRTPEKNPRFVIEKLVYKADKTTSSYWGYYQVNIYSAADKKKIYGKPKPIGKTAY